MLSPFGYKELLEITLYFSIFSAFCQRGHFGNF